MKAEILGTGEIVEYIGTSSEYGKTSYIDSDEILQQKSMDGKIKILEYSYAKEIDWEQRQFDIYVTLIQKCGRREAAERAGRCIETYKEVANVYEKSNANVIKETFAKLRKNCSEVSLVGIIEIKDIPKTAVIDKDIEDAEIYGAYSDITIPQYDECDFFGFYFIPLNSKEYMKFEVSA